MADPKKKDMNPGNKPDKTTPPKKIEGDDGKPHYPNELYEEKLPPQPQNNLK